MQWKHNKRRSKQFSQLDAVFDPHFPFDTMSQKIDYVLSEVRTKHRIPKNLERSIREKSLWLTYRAFRDGMDKGERDRNQSLWDHAVNSNKRSLHDLNKIVDRYQLGAVKGSRAHLMLEQLKNECQARLQRALDRLGDVQ